MVVRRWPIAKRFVPWSKTPNASLPSSPAVAASTVNVVLKLEPMEPGKGFEFVDAIKGGVVPREYIPAVEKGVEDTLKAGVLAGYPVVDVKVTLHFGSYHEVDSNENAFRMAASMAFKDGMRKANPVLLEPIMKVEVETPEEKMGDVMGDLSSRRGVIPGYGRSPRWRQGYSLRSAAWLKCSVTPRRCASLTQGSCNVHDGIRSLR